MTTDDVQSLRAEIEELKLQRQDLRQLKNYHQAEVLKWKEEARVAKEREGKAIDETAWISSLLGYWEDEAARLKDGLKEENDKTRKAEEEVMRLRKMLEESEAGWKAEAAMFRDEIQGLADKEKAGEEQSKQSATRLQQLFQHAKTSEATVKATQEELTRSKATVTQLQSTLQEERAAHSLNTQEAAKAKNAQEEQWRGLVAQAKAQIGTLSERVGAAETQAYGWKPKFEAMENQSMQIRAGLTNQITTLTEKVKTTEAQANNWKMKCEVMEKELVMRVKALEEAEGSAGESSRKRKKTTGSADVNGSGSQTRVKKEEPMDPVIPT
ncbi:hypothetical protein FA13DRAFT_1785693 [Coprinellus micaceus]|uniref:Uncharacterized protein n=1 Tax=Coprinellus micaceus TaxID=71717 RepID=A0A4Y7TW50_COPMI|nr:hypothetical protein FA13DRAFT_1785693 [Coprinellus micaceus]